MRNRVMQGRPLFAMLAATVLVCGLGTPEARADFVPLPATLDQLTGAGNFTTVQNINELERFSQFSYSTGPVNLAPTAANVTVSAFGPAGNEAGLSFSGAFFAAANQVTDYRISYVVSAPAGFVINDALLSAAWNTFQGSTGTGSITELFTPLSGGSPISLTLNSSNAGDVPSLFSGANEFLVQKDIQLVGGSGGIGVSVINQAFSAVPEPTSMALLGIGMTGFFAFRRFSRRASAA